MGSIAPLGIDTFRAIRMITYCSIASGVHYILSALKTIVLMLTRTIRRPPWCRCI